MNINKQHYLTVLLGFITTFLSLTVHAQGTIEVKSEAFKQVLVETEDGKQVYKMVKPDIAIPGDEILYVNTIKNIGNESASNIKIDNPIPNNSAYVDGTAFGSGTDILFSVDKGKTFNTPDKLTIIRGGEKVIADPDEYTNIRWIFKPELAPGKQSKVTFKAVIK